MSQTRRRVWCSWCAALAGATCVAGCTEFRNHRAGLEGLYAAGRYDQAAAVLDDPRTHAMYGSKNEALWRLDRGAVALALGDDDRAIDLLNHAEDASELKREKSGGDVLAQWVINDTEAPYVLEPYEDIYLNVIKILAQLQAGRVDGGATVEARRMATKADMLRDRWLKYEEAVQQRGGQTLATAQGGGGGGLQSVNKSGQFIESTLGTYLTAITFMKSGNREFQRVAGKRLIDSIRFQEGLIGPVRGEDFADIEELSPSAANVLFVGLSGRGPTKYPQRIGPIPLGTVPVYFELPYLQVHPSEAASARAEVEGVEGGSPQELKLVEDLGAVAAENHARALPAIQSRTIVRYMVKAGVSVALTEAARRSAHDSNQGWVQLAGVLGGLVVLGATEQADLRCWIFLPGQARVGLMKLPEGRHRVRIVFQSAGGGDLYATEWKDVDVTENGLTSIVGQFWR